MSAQPKSVCGISHNKILKRWTHEASIEKKKDIVGDKHGDKVKTKPMYVKFIKMTSLFYKEMVIDVASF